MDSSKTQAAGKKVQIAGRTRRSRAPVASRRRDQGGSFPIVGIGASAGGLEAIEQFLRHVPAGSGMAFVVVQHLDPDPQGDDGGAAPAGHAHEGRPGQGPPEGRAGPRVRDPAQPGHVDPARGAAPAGAGSAARVAPAHRFLLAFPGRRPARPEHRRDPLGHGLGRHARGQGHQGAGGGGLCAGARLGQVRCHASQCDRRRAGRRGGARSRNWPARSPPISRTRRWSRCATSH
jgi:hypothetical protein